MYFYVCVYNRQSANTTPSSGPFCCATAEKDRGKEVSVRCRERQLQYTQVPSLQSLEREVIWKWPSPLSNSDLPSHGDEPPWSPSTGRRGQMEAEIYTEKERMSERGELTLFSLWAHFIGRVFRYYGKQYLMTPITPITGSLCVWQQQFLHPHYILYKPPTLSLHSHWKRALYGSKAVAALLLKLLLLSSWADTAWQLLLFMSF